MAFWTCGFEAGDKTYYQDAGWVFDVDANSIISAVAADQHTSFAGRGGAYSLRVADYATSPSIGVGGRWLHFWLQGEATSWGLSFRKIGVNAFAVNFTGDGRITLGRSAVTSAIQASGSYTPLIDHWIAIEANLQTASGGQVSVYVDGVLAAQYTGDTSAASTPDWDQFYIDPLNNSSRAVDDFIITTEAEGRLGEFFCPRMAILADDTTASTTGSPDNAASARHNNVDEIPPDKGTSYNEFTAAGTDRYTTTDLGYVPTEIHCLTILGQAARDGTITQAQTVAATASGEALGAIDGLGAAGVYASWQDTFNTNPGTSSAITVVDQALDVFTIAGNVASSIVVGSIINVTGSTGNDGDWIVESVADVSTNTEITITGEIPDATADGNLTYNWISTTLDDLRVGVKFS